jgi:hypothetical protein
MSYGCLQFLRHHPGELAAPFDGLDHDIVGDDVERLLPLALRVDLCRHRRIAGAPRDAATAISLHAVWMSFSNDVRSGSDRPIGADPR